MVLKGAARNIRETVQGERIGRAKDVLTDVIGFGRLDSVRALLLPTRSMNDRITRSGLQNHGSRRNMRVLRCERHSERLLMTETERFENS